MKNILFVFCFLLGIVSLCQSCKKESLLARPSLLVADSLMWTHPDSSLRLLEQMASPEKLKGADRALYALLLTQARYKNCVLLKNDSLIRIAVRYYEKSKDKERLAESYFYLGCVYVERRNLPKAIRLFLKSLETMSKRDDFMFVSMVYSHLGNCYNAQDLRITAREMYKKCYALCQTSDSVRSCYALNDIGDTFLVDGQRDSALYYYQKALKVATPIRHEELLSVIYNDMAGLYNDEGKYTEAEALISKALLYISDKEDYFLTCSTKGDILNNMNQSDSALYYWNRSTESSNIYVKASSYNSMFQEYRRLGDWRKATFYVDSFLTYYDSIHVMNTRMEVDKLMDNHLVEIHKHNLTARQQKVIAGWSIVFLSLISFLIIVYLWRDKCRKSKYMALQQRLMENRAKMLILNDAAEYSPTNKDMELYRLEEERFDICKSLFETTQGYIMLNELIKTTPKVRIHKADANRKMIRNDIIKTFADIMGDLKDHYPTLTSDDLLYCILSLLHCPKDILLDVMEVISTDAIKTRKSRIKHKIGTELFNRIFDY